MYRTTALVSTVLVVLFQFSAANLFGLSTRNLLKEMNQKTDACSQDLIHYLIGLSRGETWAISMFDATSKLQSGLTQGNMVDLGDFDLCISIKNESNAKTIKGKYCMGLMNLAMRFPNLNSNDLLEKPDNKETAIPILNWIWSFCVPDSCKGEEAVDALNSLFQDNGIPAYLTSIIPNDKITCQTEDTIYIPLNGGAIAAICFFSLVLAIMVIQTSYDLYLYYFEKKSRHELLIAFSVLTNGKKLFTIVKREEQLPCLDGIRFISIMWVVFGHEFSSTLTDFAMINAQDMINWADGLYSMYIGSGTLSVDTFFLIGGLLVTYSYMRAISKGVKFNIIMFYVHRYLRLTPALAALTLLIATLTPYIGNGPNFPTFLKYYTDVCQKYWWSTLLYIQNYVNVGQMCIGHSWYLNVDTQLFFLSPILLIPLKKWPRQTIAATVVIILATMGGTAYIGYHYQIDALLTSTIRNETVVQNYYYITTHTRASPWLIGFILGFYIFQIKSKAISFKIHKLLALGLWGASLSLLLTCIFAGHDTLRGPDFELTGNILHLTFIRPVWALALSWVILACLFGYGGPINGLLSLPIFQVLNRLTYSIYLIHVLYVYGSVYARRTNIYFSDYRMMHLFWGDLAFSIGMAIAWTLAFESPMIIIEKYLFGRSAPQPRKEDANKA